ncbi:Hypothetical predicted protein [Mytilus galloprovincialis]|uniref:WAP domain-containing protein n=1 Tax=Mytilus galloprovincialis TaxID=29158 RepID=A0A8B6CMW1_MYTGA|nr:Hypothetical predicted protein [Mytilus galloprovincialis]
MMWSAMILLLCVIHSHSAINPPCPRIKQTGKCLGLPKTDKCQTDSECGHDSMCCPKECGKECTVKRKWGLCPTLTDKPVSVCVEVRIGFQCGGNDADCAGTKKCCPDICGSRMCKEPATKPRPECPSRFSQTKAAACHFHECSHDKECTKDKICCDVTCGIGCTEPNVN